MLRFMIPIGSAVLACGFEGVRFKGVIVGASIEKSRRLYWVRCTDDICRWFLEEQVERGAKDSDSREMYSSSVTANMESAC